MYKNSFEKSSNKALNVFLLSHMFELLRGSTSRHKIVALRNLTQLPSSNPQPHNITAKCHLPHPKSHPALGQGPALQQTITMRSPILLTTSLICLSQWPRR